MSVISTDSLQLALVPESVPRQTPANPVFSLIRTSGEGLQFAPNTSDSAEMGGSGRSQRPSNVVGFAVSGDINFELADAPWLDYVIQGVLASYWGHCPLIAGPGGAIDSDKRITVGDALQTFTLEKRFPSGTYQPGDTGAATADVTAPAAPTVTMSGGPWTGTGYVVIKLQITGQIPKTYSVPVEPGTGSLTDDQVATAVANFLTSEDPPNFGGGAGQGSAVAAAAVVTLTAPGGVNFLSVDAAAGPDQYLYQRYKGVSFSTLNLSVSPNATVTGSAGIVGGVPELDVFPISGATYISAGDGAVFTAPEISRLQIGEIFGINTHCWSSVNVALDSQNRGIPCLGTQGDREVVLGRMTASLSGEVYFTDQQILEIMLANQSAGDGAFTLSSADGAILRFDFFEMKPTSATLVAGGTGQDLTIPVTLEPTPVVVCRDGQNVERKESLIISKEDVAPVMPAPVPTAPITVADAGGGTATATLTFSGGPADQAYTFTATTIESGGVAFTGFSPVAIAPNQTTEQTASAVAAMLDGLQDAGATITLQASAAGSVVTLTEAGGGNIDNTIDVSIT